MTEKSTVWRNGYDCGKWGCDLEFMPITVVERGPAAISDWMSGFLLGATARHNKIKET